jgi:hypothetical protein
MKKGIAAILLVLYVAFSTGVVISFHYCMNDLDSLQLGAAKTEICGKCGMHQVDANACCNDEIKIFKIQDDQQASAINFKFSAPDIVITPLPFLPEPSFTNSIPELFSTSHSPPISKRYAYLQNCVFRI